LNKVKKWQKVQFSLGVPISISLPQGTRPPGFPGGGGAQHSFPAPQSPATTTAQEPPDTQVFGSTHDGGGGGGDTHLLSALQIKSSRHGSPDAQQPCPRPPHGGGTTSTHFPSEHSFPDPQDNVLTVQAPKTHCHSFTVADVAQESVSGPEASVQVPLMAVFAPSGSVHTAAISTHAPLKHSFPAPQVIELAVHVLLTHCHSFTVASVTQESVSGGGVESVQVPAEVVFAPSGSEHTTGAASIFMDIVSVPILPLLSVTEAVIVCVPTLKELLEKLPPEPIGPLMLELHDSFPVRTPSSGSVADPVKPTGSPAVKDEPSGGAVMETTGGLLSETVKLFMPDCPTSSPVTGS